MGSDLVNTSFTFRVVQDRRRMLLVVAVAELLTGPLLFLGSLRPSRRRRFGVEDWSFSSSSPDPRCRELPVIKVL